MKILVLINSFGRGGAEKSTTSFILKLTEQYEAFNFICVYLHSFQPGFYGELESKKIPLIHLQEKNLYLRVKKLKGIIKAYDPDVIHSVLFESNIISRLASIGSDKIFVESFVNKPYFEDREFQSESVKFKRKLIRIIDKKTSQLVDKFHSVGNAVAAHYREVYKRDFKYMVVHRGRPISDQILNPEKKSNSKLVLITLARHEYQKGLIYLLEAVGNLRGKVFLKVLGRDGAATPALKSYIRQNGLEKDVELCGFVKDIHPVVQRADLYVSASLYEGLPGSVIEAMALKKPLLLSDIEEHREVAQENENALFFPSKDVDVITIQIKKFINNPELLTRYGERSFDIFKEEFTEDAMVKGMADFYFSLDEK